LILPTTGHIYRRAYLAWNYWLRTANGGRWTDHCRPTDIALLMTNLCNAKCVHCDIWKNKGREETPTVEQYKLALSELRAWLGPAPIFFTGGEALLRPYTVDLLAHASRIGLHAELLTHGYWDDQSRIEKVALAKPARVTISLDGMGDTHTKIRGRENFFEKTTRSLETLRRVRSENRLRFVIRLKTVVMDHNIGDLEPISVYAADKGYEVFYQPVEQNYNTPEDPRWFDHSDTWPKDPSRTGAAVRRLIELKQQGLPIRNSYGQLETMIRYFENPDAMRVSVQAHAAHEEVAICSASTALQIMPNGDVLGCSSMPAFGNIQSTSIREIWRNRPAWWRGGCCQETRCTSAEKENRGLVVLGDGTRAG
jgi:MoaA/NifB/PqqE/SkfB family radical SAM enzyme